MTTKKKEAFRIFGTGGEFSVDAEGIPIGIIPGHYEDIVRVNVEELRSWMKEKSIPETRAAPELGIDVDILNIGYWYKKGEEKIYLEPDEQYRRMTEAGGVGHVFDEKGQRVLKAK